MKNSKLYDEKSIESLNPLEFTRLRPQVYAGDCTYSTQLLVEILSNSIDEYRLGHGNVIDITLNKNICTVRDYGQGFIPNSYRPDGKTILEAAFSVLNTSGKYREDGAYEGTSLGSFGIGSKITVFLSHWLRVSTWRDNQYEEILFKEGKFENRISNAEKVEHSGTQVTWEPSEEFFTNVEVEIDKIKSLLRTLSCLCKGLTINFYNNGEKIIYYSENGLSDLVDDKVKNKEILNHRFEMNFTEDKNKLDLIMTYTSDYSSRIVPYVNTGLTESGTHISSIKSAITRVFNKFARDKKFLKDKDENLTGDDIQEGMYLVFNITASGVGYDAQVKSRITKIDMKPFLTAFTENYEAWLSANEKDAKSIVDKALSARKAREAAKKAKEAVRNKEVKKQKALKFDSKLADCYSKTRSKCEIYVTEGK